MYTRFSFFFSKNSVEQVATMEMEKLASKFHMSRTGDSRYDRQKENVSNNKNLPEVFEKVYAKNSLSEEGYAKLDNFLISAREKSNNIKEYREFAEQLGYANCTTLACFMHEALKEQGFESKLFGIGGAHHFVIAKHEETDKLVVIDPWAHVQFTISIKDPVENLENTSVRDRLLIAKLHYQNTGLYPNYEEGLNNQLSKISPHSKYRDSICESYFEISETERYLEFNGLNQNPSLSTENNNFN